MEKTAYEDRIEKKKSALDELVLRYIAEKTLRERNAKATKQPTEKLQWPFIVVKSKPNIDISCEVRSVAILSFFLTSVADILFWFCCIICWGSSSVLLNCKCECR